MSFLRKRLVYHSLSWLIVLCALYLSIVRSSESLDAFGVLRIMLVIVVPVLVVVYGHFLIKDLFLKKRKYALYAIFVIGIISIGVMIDSVLQYFITEVDSSVTQTTVNLTSILLLTSGFQYFKSGIVNQYYNQELKVKNIESELKLLKAQMNPHFMFNTLNNVYAVNQQNATKGSEMILELSDVMRYHLEGSKREFISLEEELNLINSYISLEKLRLTDTTEVDLKVDVKNRSLKIAPLLLLPFIENAFKYGTHPTKPSKISIKLGAQKEQVLFSISNQIIRDKKVVKTNIGLENVSKRVGLLYPSKHALNIKEEADQFHVKLTLHV